MEYIPIAVIVNTHGLRGTVKVKSFTDFKELRYQKGQTLYIAYRDQKIPVTVQAFRSVKTVDYLDFEEYSDINLVEKFKGSELLLNRSDMHELEEDEFYYEELIGMIVYTDQLIGVVSEVRDLPQGQLLVIKKEKGQALVPFRKEFVKEVNKQDQTITLIEWEGLL